MKERKRDGMEWNQKIVELYKNKTPPKDKFDLDMCAEGDI